MEGVLVRLRYTVKAKDSPWYAVFANLSVASTVTANVLLFLNSVNIFKDKFLNTLVFTAFNMSLFDSFLNKTFFATTLFSKSLFGLFGFEFGLFFHQLKIENWLS